MNRYLGALFLGVCLSSTALVGCGDDSAEDDDGETQSSKGTVNEATAASTISQSTRAVANLQTGDGAGAALTMASVGASAFALVTPGQSGAASAAVPAPELGTAASAECTEECTGDETGGSCTFSGCTIEGGGASWTIEGTVGWTASHLDCDISYSGSYTGLSYTMNVFCNVDYSATSIDGEVSTDGTYTADNGQGGTAEFSWDTSIVYNDVQFPEGGGCPTAGSVDLDASVDVNGQSYSAEATLSFPAAGCTG